MTISTDKRCLFLGFLLTIIDLTLIFVRGCGETEACSTQVQTKFQLDTGSRRTSFARLEISAPAGTACFRISRL